MMLVVVGHVDVDNRSALGTHSVMVMMAGELVGKFKSPMFVGSHDSVNNTHLFKDPKIAIRRALCQ
jgi:hypothetical protein